MLKQLRRLKDLIKVRRIYSKNLIFAWVPSGSSAFARLATFDWVLGKNLPQSTKGANVMTMPAAAINFRKSRLDTRGLLLIESPRLTSITYPETGMRACDKNMSGY